MTATARDPQGAADQRPPSGLTPPRPQGGATAPDPREALFRSGPVTLHSGEVSNFKIDCDALTGEDWKTLAFMLADHVGRFSKAVGVPRGGLKLAHYLNGVAWSQGDPVLIVDDVLTTGASMEKMRAEILNDAPDREIKGAVIFARGPAPAWVTALFVLTPAPASARSAAPSEAAPAEYSAEEISRLASIRALVRLAQEREADAERWTVYYAADMAWLLARLDPRESTARAAAEDPRAAPPREASGGATGPVPMCACGHSKLSHPVGLSGHIALTGNCWGCNCEQFAPTSPVAGAPQEDQRTHEDKMRDVQNYVSAGGTWPPVEGGLTPDVERVVRAAGRLSPGVWRQLGKWLRTREGMGGPWDPDDPPVLAQIANEVDEIADALAALRVAPAPPHES